MTYSSFLTEKETQTCLSFIVVGFNELNNILKTVLFVRLWAGPLSGPYCWGYKCLH